MKHSYLLLQFSVMSEICKKLKPLLVDLSGTSITSVLLLKPGVSAVLRAQLHYSSHSQAQQELLQPVNTSHTIYRNPHQLG